VVSFDVNEPDELLLEFLGDSSGDATFVKGDIVDRGSVERLANSHFIDKIVHAAVYTVNRVALEIERSRDVVAINIEGTANLLELARTQKVTRFVYVSSGAVYGSALPGDQTLNEDTPPAPSNLYGITKFASEMITQRYSELHGISTVSVRLSTPYGPMERVTDHRAVMSVFYDWTGQAVRGDSITLADSDQDMDQGRDYTYVTDIAEGLRAVLDAPVLPHGLYNITAGTWVTFQEILDGVVGLFPSMQVVTPAASQVKPEYGRGPLSGHRLSEDLGWKPRYDLKAGLADYIQWRMDSGFFD